MKRLAHIVVGSKLESDNSVDRIFSSTDDYDSASPARMQFAQQIESVFDAEIEIKQDQIVSVLLQPRHHAGSGARYCGPESVVGKIPRQHSANCVLIVDDKNVRQVRVLRG